MRAVKSFIAGILLMAPAIIGIVGDEFMNLWNLNNHGGIQLLLFLTGGIGGLVTGISLFGMLIGFVCFILGGGRK